MLTNGFENACKSPLAKMENWKAIVKLRSSLSTHVGLKTITVVLVTLNIVLTLCLLNFELR